MKKRAIHLWKAQCVICAAALVCLLWRTLGTRAVFGWTLATVPLWSPIVYALFREELPHLSQGIILGLYLLAATGILACSKFLPLRPYRPYCFILIVILFGAHLGRGIYKEVSTHLSRWRG
jgi:hypothetical protein